MTSLEDLCTLRQNLIKISLPTQLAARIGDSNIRGIIDMR